MDRHASRIEGDHRVDVAELPVVLTAAGTQVGHPADARSAGVHHQQLRLVGPRRDPGHRNRERIAAGPGGVVVGHPDRRALRPPRVLSRTCPHGLSCGAWEVAEHRRRAPLLQTGGEPDRPGPRAYRSLARQARPGAGVQHTRWTLYRDSMSNADVDRVSALAIRSSPSTIPNRCHHRVPRCLLRRRPVLGALPRRPWRAGAVRGLFTSCGRRDPRTRRPGAVGTESDGLRHGCAHGA